MNIFSPLTSQIFGGALVLGAAWFVIDEVADNRAYSKLEKRANDLDDENDQLKVNLATARGNVTSLKAGLNQCNAGVAAAAAQRQAMARAGAAAVAEVRKAGEDALAATRRTLDSMPTDGATAAEQCAQADAILQGGAR